MDDSGSCHTRNEGPSSGRVCGVLRWYAEETLSVASQPKCSTHFLQQKEGEFVVIADFSKNFSFVV